MLEINGKPILEIILERAINAGFKVIISQSTTLKIKSKNILMMVPNGEYPLNISEESEPLGTCGALSLHQMTYLTT